MLRIERVANGVVVFRVIGCLCLENVAELHAEFQKEINGRPIILDLQDLTLVDRESVCPGGFGEEQDQVQELPGICP